MNDGWIDIKEKLPPDKTWVECICKILGTNITFEMEWFYYSKYFDEFYRLRITHWRFITHSFFNPIVEQSFILELPANEHLR